MKAKANRITSHRSRFHDTCITALWR